jgi:hypothetical protein
MTLLKQVIMDNWNGREFIKIATNANLRTQIERQTSFLDGHYPDIKLKQRAFVLLNDLTEDQLPYCRCGEIQWGSVPVVEASQYELVQWKLH